MVYRPSRLPAEITSGESFRVEVNGSGDCSHDEPGGYPLRVGLRAAIGKQG
jgi:hypothetical protein